MCEHNAASCLTFSAMLFAFVYIIPRLSQNVIGEMCKTGRSAMGNAVHSLWKSRSSFPT